MGTELVWTNLCCCCSTTDYDPKKIWETMIFGTDVKIHKTNCRKIYQLDYHGSPITVNDVIFEIPGMGMYYFYINVAFGYPSKWHRSLKDCKPYLVSFEKGADYPFIKDADIKLDSDYNIVTDLTEESWDGRQVSLDEYFDVHDHCKDIKIQEELIGAKVNDVYEYDFQRWREIANAGTYDTASFESILEKICFLFTLYPKDAEFDSGK